MKQVTALCMIILLAGFGCQQIKQSDNPGNWTAEQTTQWFNQKKWLGETGLQPDISISKQQLALHYFQHPGRWEKAFSFLKRQDLSTMDTGKYVLDGDDVYAMVSAYMTKNPEDANFEKHLLYTDIHMVITGSENIERADTADAEVVVPYDQDKDLALLHKADFQKLLAKPGVFYIFFPDDAHCPGLKVGESALVRKIVIKVKN